MQNKIKKIIALVCAFTLAGGIAALAGCTPTDDEKESHTTHIDANDDGKCDEGGQAMPDPDPDPDPDDPEPVDDPYNTLDTIIEHAEGETVTYRFEAECTDLSGKKGPGYSGTGNEGSMATSGAGASNGGCVSYLYGKDMSVNFLVVSDRDVENATISLGLGAEFIMVPVMPQTFVVRVDPVTNEDLAPATETGALGAWDQAFLNYYTVEDTGGYIIDEFECPATSVIDGSALTSPGNFQKFTISTKLSLKKGVNSISIVIQGLKLLEPTGTMSCTAPVVDYMEITTDAQLGFFNQHDNLFGKDGLEIVD